MHVRNVGLSVPNILSLESTEAKVTGDSISTTGGTGCKAGVKFTSMARNWARLADTLLEWRTYDLPARMHDQSRERELHLLCERDGADLLYPEAFQRYLGA